MSTAMSKVGALAVMAGVLAGAGVAAAGQAQANPGVGCETIRWGFLGSQRRTLCDGPVQPGGEWMRARVVWTPAHQVPFSCSGGVYYSSCWGGYFVEESYQSREIYPVTPATVLPDEPGHLQAGLDVLR